MLQLRPGCECCDRDLPARLAGCDDLLVRVHVLSGVRDDGAPGQVSELRRRARGAPASPGRQAGEVPGVDRAHPQAGRVPKGRLAKVCCGRSRTFSASVASMRQRGSWSRVFCGSSPALSSGALAAPSDSIASRSLRIDRACPGRPGAARRAAATRSARSNARAERGNGLALRGGERLELRQAGVAQPVHADAIGMPAVAKRTARRSAASLEPPNPDGSMR